MNKKIIQMIGTNVAVCLVLVLIDWFQWDIIIRITEKYNGLVSELFFYLILGIKIVSLIAILVIDIKYITENFSRLKLISCLPTIMLVFILTLQCLIPFTDSYVNWEYHFNQESREKIVSMLEGKEELELNQTDTDTYILPFELRSASYNAKITTEKNDGSLKVLFYAHRGLLKNIAVIYVSDMDNVTDGDFNLKYNQITPIDEHWYLVKH